MVIVMTDLGFGDACKGSITYFLSHLKKAHTIIRSGGCQALHNVVTSQGVHHCHVQFSSGTLVGSRTHLSEHMVICPYAILREGFELEKIYGSVFEKMTIDENCLVITFFQRTFNRLRELARGDNRHGSVGMGIGETVADSKVLGDAAIFAKDLNKPYLRDKLKFIREYKLKQLPEIIDQLDLSSGQVKEELNFLYDESVVDLGVETFNKLAKYVAIVGSDYLDTILTKEGTVIFEPSQGVLLDQDYGFYPYNTFVTTTSADILDLLKNHNYQGDILRFGLIRGYQHRHGAGPFVTEDSFLTEQLLDKYNCFHPWQRNWRVGQLDMVMLQYAIEVCGGPQNFNGLAVSCLDLMLEKNIPYQICQSYSYLGFDKNLEDFFNFKDGKITGIKVYQGKNIIQHQEKLTNLLKNCHPVLTDFGQGQADLRDYLGTIEYLTKIKITIESYGPSEINKIVLNTL